MTETTCGYPGNRDEAIVGYVYGEMDGASRAVFDRHLVDCAACRQELGALAGVRVQLAHWAPPEPARALVREPVVATARWWQQVPAWAQVAAAMLVIGASASVANLNIHYGRDGLTVRTGWMKPVVEAAAPAPVVTPVATTTASPAPWRTDLAALEQELRSELRQQQARSARATLASAASPSGMSEAEVLRRVQQLVDDSEKKQQRELALRVAQVAREVEAQRRADLVKIDNSLGLIQNNTGIEVMKQRELLNYLVRVSQKQ